MAADPEDRQLVVTADTRAAFGILAAEYEALAAEQRALMRAARVGGGTKYKIHKHQLRMETYERCAQMARAVLPGGAG